MTTPKILGRMEDDDSIDERASTNLVCSEELAYEGGAVGKVTVSVFKSSHDEDRGGFVFRIEIEDCASSFIPHAVNTENGVELHMAGDIESVNLVQALKKALNKI